MSIDSPPNIQDNKSPGSGESPLQAEALAYTPRAVTKAWWRFDEPIAPDLPKLEWCHDLNEQSEYLKAKKNEGVRPEALTFNNFDISIVRSDRRYSMWPVQNDDRTQAPKGTALDPENVFLENPLYRPARDYIAWPNENILALKGAKVIALAGSHVRAENGSDVVAFCGAEVDAGKGASVNAHPGASIISNGAKVNAEVPRFDPKHIPPHFEIVGAANSLDARASRQFASATDAGVYNSLLWAAADPDAPASRGITAGNDDQFAVVAAEGDQVVARNGAKVLAGSGSTVVAYDKSQVRALAGSKVQAYKNSTVGAYAGSLVEAEESFVWAYDNSAVRARGSSSVFAGKGAAVAAYFDTTVHAGRGSNVYGGTDSNIIAGAGSSIIAVSTAIVRGADTANISQASSNAERFWGNRNGIQRRHLDVENNWFDIVLPQGSAKKPK